MLGREPFRHDLLRKYELVFGAMFNEIHLTRRDKDTGGVAQLIKVPLSYAPKEKILARVLADPGIDRQAAVTLPRMSFELTNISYNGRNMLGSTRRNVIRVTTDGDDDSLLDQLNPAPYDLHFTLWVFTKYAEDGNQIVEQILPYFTPNFTATLNLIEGVNIDCQVRLDDVGVQDMYTGEFSQRRTTMWTLHFTMTGYLFGPVRTRPVIKFANVSFRDSTTHDDIRTAVGNVPPIDRVTVQPGMDANGNPTTNVDISVDYHDIKATDDWDYAVTISGSLVPGDIGPP